VADPRGDGAAEAPGDSESEARGGDAHGGDARGAQAGDAAGSPPADGQPGGSAQPGTTGDDPAQQAQAATG
jgi:hypothetical protein